MGRGGETATPQQKQSVCVKTSAQCPTKEKHSLSTTVVTSSKLPNASKPPIKSSCRRILVGEACLVPSTAQSVSPEPIQHPLTREPVPGAGVRGMGLHSREGQRQLKPQAAGPQLQMALPPPIPVSWTHMTFCTWAMRQRRSGGLTWKTRCPSPRSRGSAVTLKLSLLVAMTPFQLFMYFLKIRNFLKGN